MTKVLHRCRALGPASLLAVWAVASVPVEAAGIKCEIPFSFMVGKTTLPAGTYRVSSNETTLSIRGFADFVVIQSDTVLSAKHAGTRLVFHKYGDRYFLSQAWMDAGRGRQLRQSPAEREVAGAARSADALESPQQVAVAGR